METIKQLIYDGKTDEAIRLLDEIITGDPALDEAFYLRGNAFRKAGDWRQALNNYLVAMELNPDSPAHQAYQMIIDILDFYNKDLFNQ
ncbi:MAG: tetratricopeptide repeat protein [Tannerella sp.]|jgi:tetratricopeptide (TPR) repeat protein|nr:tetratricopeptide repeat protein [Tannerella sp.]